MTTPNSLKSLTLNCFRGSTGTFKIKFEKDRKLTLVYGENGCGKTTVCDAFQFLSDEKVGSLEDKGMGKALDKFWPSAGKDQNDLAVFLETSKGVCEGRIVNKKISVGPESDKPRIELLRRKQILDVIEAQPAQRYQAIKQFIDIDLFERSEETLLATCKRITQ
jgi:predicted ATP-binding protein involved in virulence